MSVLQVPPPVGTSGQFLDSIVITSSTNRQVIILGDPTSTAGLASVTTTGGMLTAVSNPTTAVSLSSSPTVLTTGPYLVVSASSGLVQLSSQITVAISSGVVTLSSATSLSSGTVTLSSATSLSSGTVTLSSAPLVVTASSGFLQPMPLTTGGISAFAYTASCSGNMVNVKGSPTVFWGFYALNTSQTIRYLRIYDTTSAPVVGVTTSQIIGHYGIPASTGSGGAGGQHIIEPYGVTASAGLGFNIGINPSATDTGSSTGGDLVLTLYYV